MPVCERKRLLEMVHVLYGMLSVYCVVLVLFDNRDVRLNIIIVTSCVHLRSLLV